MRMLGWAAAAALLFAGSAAGAASFDRLYVFGDSLVDSGNAAGVPSANIDPVRYPTGRFTNGYNFADDLSVALGLGLTGPVQVNGVPANGTDFAVGGATTAAFPNQGSPDFNQQIKGYYAPFVAAKLTPAIDANSLVLVTTGGNDVRDFLLAGALSTPDTAIQAALATVNALDTGLRQLIAAGARNILVVNVPDIGLIPSLVTTPYSALASDFSRQLDTGVSKLLAASSYAATANGNLVPLESYSSVVNDLQSSLLGTGGQIQLFDLASLQTAINTSPASFGFNAALLKTDCVDNGGTGTSACAGYAYYDGIHPTAAVHGLIAQQLAALVPEPASWALMVLGFGVTGTALRRARRTAAFA